jgi:hypothetical protein
MLTNEQLEDLATLHIAPQLDKGEALDLLPLLRAVEAAAMAAGLARAHNAGFVEASRIHGAEIEAWRRRFPQFQYRAQDACVALRLSDALAAL